LQSDVGADSAILPPLDWGMGRSVTVNAIFKKQLKGIKDYVIIKIRIK